MNLPKNLTKNLTFRRFVCRRRRSFPAAAALYSYR